MLLGGRLSVAGGGSASSWTAELQDQAAACDLQRFRQSHKDSAPPKIDGGATDSTKLQRKERGELVQPASRNAPPAVEPRGAGCAPYIYVTLVAKLHSPTVPETDGKSCGHMPRGGPEGRPERFQGSPAERQYRLISESPPGPFPLATKLCARPPHRTAAAGAQRELTHSQNELQLGGRLVLAPFEALNTEICVVSLRRASGAAREGRFAGAVSSSELRLFVDVDDFPFSLI